MSEPWEFSLDVIDKAHRYIRESRVKQGADGVWWVSGSAIPITYRVQTDAADGKATWITCSCPHGQHAGGLAKCSHAVAVLLTIRGDWA